MEPPSNPESNSVTTKETAPPRRPYTPPPNPLKPSFSTSVTRMESTYDNSRGNSPKVKTGNLPLSSANRANIHNRMNPNSDAVQPEHKTTQNKVNVSHKAVQTKIKVSHKATQTEVKVAHKSVQTELKVANKAVQTCFKKHKYVQTLPEIPEAGAVARNQRRVKPRRLIREKTYIVSDPVIFKRSKRPAGLGRIIKPPEENSGFYEPEKSTSSNKSTSSTSITRLTSRETSTSDQTAMSPERTLSPDWVPERALPNQRTPSRRASSSDAIIGTPIENISPRKASSNYMIEKSPITSNRIPNKKHLTKATMNPPKRALHPSQRENRTPVMQQPGNDLIGKESNNQGSMKPSKKDVNMNLVMIKKAFREKMAANPLADETAKTNENYDYKNDWWVTM